MFFRVFFILFLLSSAGSLAQDNSTRLELYEELFNDYIPAAKDRALNLEDTVNSKLQNQWKPRGDKFEPGQKREFYGGNTTLGIADALQQDFQENFSEIFDCLDFEFIRFIFSDFGIPTGMIIDFSWPVQHGYTGHFFQNRYLPEQMYDQIKDNDLLDSMYYPLLETKILPTVFFDAQWRVALEGTKRLHSFDMSETVSNAADLDLDKAPKDSRYIGGDIQGSNPQLEFGVMPSLLHTAWEVILEYFQILKLLRCRPPEGVPIPYSSDLPYMMPFTRDPYSFVYFPSDLELQDDIRALSLDAAACARFLMARSGKIPNDLYLPSAGAIINGQFTNLPLLTAMPESQQEKYERVCIENWGATLPMTTMHGTHTSDIIHAGLNFIKATRLSWAWYIQYLRSDFPRDSQGNVKDKNPYNWSSSSTYFISSYMFDPKEDKMQYTFHDDAPKKCMKAGEFGPIFPGADTKRRPDKHGLYSITHWKRFRCESDLF